MTNNTTSVRSAIHPCPSKRMVRVQKTHLLLVSLAVLLVGLPLTGRTQTTFSNTTSIDIPRNTLQLGPGSLYPAPIVVSGLGTSVTNLSVTFSNLSHAYADDIDVLLVGPGSQNVLLMSDTGGLNPISGLTLTFSDAATLLLPDETQLTSGTFKPTNYDAPFMVDSFAGPAPTEGPYGSTLSAFNGTNPNGTWNLYVLDDTQGNAGVLAGGWSLTVTAVPEPSSFVLGAGALAVMGLVAMRRRRTSARP